MKEYYDKSISQTLIDLKVDKNGLKNEDVIARENTSYKENNFIKRQGILVKFFQQFFDLMIIILLCASAVSIILGIVQTKAGEIVDGCIILFIVIANAVFGVAQEYKAEKSLEALNKLTQPEIFVIRDKQREKINTSELVLGDIVVLEAGCIVPADVRLIETHSIKIDEASLTGESHAVEKDCQIICKKDSLLAERKNMAYKGSVVACGRALGVVVALGDDTELGKIAKVIKDNQKELTPLKKSIRDVGKMLTYLVIAIALITFVIEIYTSPLEIMDAFLTAVAIAVAAIPESMPAVITIIMSLGVARLAKQKAVVKRMHSVETLGCCDVICSDKTGTITQNKMTVTSVFCNNTFQEKRIAKDKYVEFLINSSLLCNDTLMQNGKIIGDPTEIALTEFAKKYQISKGDLDLKNKRISEIPFDSNRKIMSVLVNQNNKKVMYSKGALDRILSKCKYYLYNGEKKVLDEGIIEKIKQVNEKMASGALRVIAFAYKDITSLSDFKETELVFIGLMGMIDPPRKEMKEAIKKCKRAGMKPIMITGDFGKTAFAIAKEIGLAKSYSQVITGEELAKLDKNELENVIENYSIFARVSPEDKVRIVEALKKKGHIVAMTGDGVNDAPSLKKANIGIGMGKTGTDVAKEVADIIITDDNFATIVVAVEEGRKIYQNIQKTVKFLFSANLAELLSIFIVTLFYPQFVFLLPVQILFVNLITDSLPAIALGVEKTETNLMEEKPRDSKKGLFANGVGWSIIVLGLFQTLFVVLAYIIGLKCFNDKIATTMGFYTLNIIQMFYLASMRTKVNIFKSKPFKNKFFLLAVGFCFLLVGIFAFTPVRNLLNLEILNATQWGIIFAFSMLMLIVSEIYKFLEKIIMCKKNKIVKE